MTNNQNEEKIDILMNKLTFLENAIKEERKLRFKCEEELKNLKTLTIPNLEKQLEEKESLLKTTFIEKIRLEKELHDRTQNVPKFIINSF
jgi:hypothetical protein